MSKSKPIIWTCECLIFFFQTATLMTHSRVAMIFDVSGILGNSFPERSLLATECYRFVFLIFIFFCIRYPLQPIFCYTASGSWMFYWLFFFLDWLLEDIVCDVIQITDAGLILFQEYLCEFDCSFKTLPSYLLIHSKFLIYI